MTVKINDTVLNSYLKNASELELQAILWYINYIETPDIEEASEGCDCPRCLLVRAIERFVKKAKEKFIEDNIESAAIKAYTGFEEVKNDE